MSKKPSHPSYTPEQVAAILRAWPTVIQLRGRIAVLVELESSGLKSEVKNLLRADLDKISELESSQ